MPEMSYSHGMDKIQEALTLTLMLVLFFVVFYLDMGFLYKVFVAVLVSCTMFLMGLANQAVKQAEDQQF
jgi:uncharacterized membrane protein YGL010W